MIKKIERNSILLLILLSPTYVHTVIVDRTVTTISVGDTPSRVAITPDGYTAYVANNNNDGITGGNTVSVINLQTNKVIKVISDSSFNQPYLMAINAQGSRVYVTNSQGFDVSVIDTATNTVVDVIPNFDGPSGIVLSPDGRYAYVSNYGGPESGGGSGSGNGTTVQVVDLATNTIIGSAITVDLAPTAVAISPDGAFLYVLCYVTGDPGTGIIDIVSTSTNKIVTRITGFSGPYTMVMSSDGKYGYVSNFGSNNFSPVGRTVSVIDLRANSIITNITVGVQPSGLAITPNGYLLYVSNYNTLYLGPDFTDLTAGMGIINIIDLRTNKVLRQEMIAGASPADVTISPDGKRAYVANYDSNDVTVFNIEDTMWLNKSC